MLTIALVALVLWLIVVVVFKITKVFIHLVLVAALVLLAIHFLRRPVVGRALDAAQSGGVQVGVTDIGGVVTGATGPEAGVWVIAETNDLPTKYVKIVVTDDRGRYLIPDLPKANYSVWVRGYGLIDSPKSTSAPGRTV